MLAERLADLHPAQAAPSWRELTDDERDVPEQVRTLPGEALPVLTEVLVDSWDEIPEDDRAQLCALVASRLQDVEDSLGFAAALDRLTAAAAVVRAPAADELQDRLLETIREHLGHDADEQAAPRARFALGAAVDLVCAGAAQRYALMALLDQLRRELRADLASPAARAAGRLAEEDDDPLYRQVLERALEFDDGQADACVELGHTHLRQGAAAKAFEDARSALVEAQRFYRDAIAADETRPDAAAFAAAVELTLAFAGGAEADALAAPAAEIERAAWELAAYQPEDAPSRTVEHVASWLTLVARLRGAAEVLDGRGLLDLQRALLSLLDVYADSRVRVLGMRWPSLRVVIAPRIEQWVSDNEVPRAALAELRERLSENDALREPIERLLAIAAEPPGKPWRSASQPDSPGCSALGDSPLPTPTGHRKPSS
jgi:hypothetical protein